jgi:hypothetical protein
MADTDLSYEGDSDDRYWSPISESPVRSVVLRTLFVIGVVLFAAFWIWALFFASKTAINKIDDRAWAERAETVCAEVKPRIRLLDLEASADFGVRADLVVRSTDMLSAMLDDITATPPTDAKGQAIVPDWIADYRTLLNDRYRYADRLRGGNDVPFTETAINGVPITERIETFAGDNEMPSCAPPRGSVV